MYVEHDKRACSVANYRGGAAGPFTGPFYSRDSIVNEQGPKGAGPRGPSGFKCAVFRENGAILELIGPRDIFRALWGIGGRARELFTVEFPQKGPKATEHRY